MPFPAGVDAIARRLASNAATASFSNVTGATFGGKAFTATGATVARTLAARFSDEVNVKDFGATGAGVSDDTAAIQAATDAVQSRGGGTVFLPAGRFLTSSAIALTSYTGISFVGEGSNATQILTQTATQDAFIFDTCESCGVWNLGINTTPTKTAGAAIHITGACNKMFIHNVWMNAPCYGIRIGGTSVLIWISDSEVIDHTASIGVGVLIEGGNDHYLDRVFVQCVQGSPALAGFQITKSGGTWMKGCGSLFNNTGLLITPGTGQTVEHLFSTMNAYDTSASNGIEITPSGTGIVRRLDFVQDWSATNAGSGVALNGGNEIVFDAFRCINNTQFGFLLNNIAATGIRIRNSLIAGNSGVSGLYSGVHVVPGVGNFSVQNNMIGAAGDFGASQPYGVYVSAGSSANYIVSGNNLLGNATASMFDGGTGVARTEGNLGYNPVGASAISVGASPFTHTAGHAPETVYISGGTVSSVVQNGVTLFSSTDKTVDLGPNESVVTTYSVAPTMNKVVH